jgi:hypothetical protein
MVHTTQENEEGNGGIQRGAGGQAAGDTTQTMGAFAPGFSVGTAVNQQAVMPATGLRGLMALAPHFGEEKIGGMNARALFQTPGGMGFNKPRGWQAWVLTPWGWQGWVPPPWGWQVPGKLPRGWQGLTPWGRQAWVPPPWGWQVQGKSPRGWQVWETLGPWEA